MSLVASVKAMLPRHVRTFDPEEVTTRSRAEVDPRDVGLTTKSVDAMWASVVRYYEMGLHPALQLCVRVKGEVVIDRAIGHARGNGPDDPREGPKELATPETLFNLFSGSKSVTAMLIHLLHQRGLLHVDEPVATFIPEFARKRKERITVRDILTHRAGMPATPAGTLDIDVLARWDELMDRVYDLEPESEPDQHQAYHAVTGGFVLGELIRRLTGLDARAFLTQEVRAPLGLHDFNYGVEPTQLHRAAIESFTGPVPTWPATSMLKRALGFSIQEAVELANDARFRTAIVPSGNIFGTAREISRFFELLRRGGEMDGRRIFREDSIARATSVQSAEVDRTIMLPIRYSMGFMLGAEVVSFYGLRSPKAFGHLGFTNVLAWADPERELSAALMNNGKPLLSAKFLAWLDIMRVIAARVPRSLRS